MAFAVDPLTSAEPGDAITRDYQYEFRGLLFGSATSYQTETVEGIIGLPSALGSDDNNDEDHGMHAGVDLLPGRTITITMNLIAEGVPAQVLLDAVTKTFQVSKRAAFVEYPFITRRPEHTKRFALCRARRAEFVSDYDLAHGLGKGGGVQLFATDPLFYSLEETELVIPIPNAAVMAQGNAAGLGDFLDGSPPIIEIAGPVTNPRIVNAADDGKTIRLDVVVGAGHTLLIDTKNKTVFLDGVDRFDTVRGDNQWWRIVPGINLITINRDNAGANTTMTVRHHEAWTGA
jgi:hypothetical protein